MRYFKIGDILSADVRVLLHENFNRQTSLRPAPRFIDNPYNQSFYTGYMQPHPLSLGDNFCVEVPDAVLYGERAVITRDNVLSFDLRSFRFEPDLSFEAMQPTFPRNGYFTSERVDVPAIEVDEPACLLSSQEHLNYGATLLRELPKILTLRRLGLTELPVVSPASSWHRELLSIFGITNIIAHNRQTSYHFKKLIMPSQKTQFFYFGQDVVSFFDEAAETISQELPHFDMPLLYVSRLSDGRLRPDHRKCLNEEELADSLGRLGFEVVEPEMYSVREQIAIFRSARFVVGPSGAGMFNTVFCRPGTDILSLEPLPLFAGQHINMFGSMGHSYGLVTGGVDPDDSREVQKSWRADVPVVLKRVEEVLRTLHQPAGG